MKPKKKLKTINQKKKKRKKKRKASSYQGSNLGIQKVNLRNQNLKC